VFWTLDETLPGCDEEINLPLILSSQCHRLDIPYPFISKGVSMNVIKMIGDFILASWLWQFTADWFHPVVTGIVMFLLMRMVLRRPRIRSLIISFLAQLFALAMLSIIAVGLLVHIFQWEFDPESLQQAQTALFYPSLGLALLYALFQTLFFLLGSFFWSANVRSYVVISWISNGLGAMISYLCIRMVEMMNYTG
jgi:hypothetical protein